MSGELLCTTLICLVINAISCSDVSNQHLLNEPYCCLHSVCTLIIAVSNWVQILIHCEFMMCALLITQVFTNQVVNLNQAIHFSVSRNHYWITKIRMKSLLALLLMAAVTLAQDSLDLNRWVEIIIILLYSWC